MQLDILGLIRTVESIDKVLNDNKNFSISDMMALQTDYYSLPSQDSYLS